MNIIKEMKIRKRVNEVYSQSFLTIMTDIIKGEEQPRRTTKIKKERKEKKEEKKKIEILQ